jgi:pimeloyl-ACP methyl ester carboxylesterase
VTADRPVLIFSGTLDPITPPVWGELVADGLPDSRHLVLEGFGHGTLFTGCTIALMNSFIESGTLEGLDTGCIDNFRRRPFFVTPGGSTPVDD